MHHPALLQVLLCGSEASGGPFSLLCFLFRFRELVKLRIGPLGGILQCRLKFVCRFCGDFANLVQFQRGVCARRRFRCIVRLLCVCILLGGCRGFGKMSRR